MVCSSEIRRLGQAISGHGRDITHRGVGLKLSLPGGNSGPETGGKPFYRAGGLHGLRGLRFAALLGRLGLHPHELEEPLACEWVLDQT